MVENRPVREAYCPRCDKKFISTISKHAAIQKMEQHMKKAHPEYLAMYKD